MQIANKTLEAINRALEADGGAKFRGYFKEALSEISDAFNDVPDTMPRTHLGGSLIGADCARDLWYGFRWAAQEKFPGRIIRLFHRGHLEEARFIALVRVAGMESWHSQDGKQFRISDHNGHYGGSLDGVARGCLDIPNGEACLLEFKTHGKSSFKKLIVEGVKSAKNQHYVQCQQYMAKFGLNWCLYMAVEKDTDELHLEVFQFDSANAQRYLERAGAIVNSEIPPPKANESPAWYSCKWCKHIKICHYNEPALKNCRTCAWAKPASEGRWVCGRSETYLTKEAQWAGCGEHQYVPGL